MEQKKADSGIGRVAPFALVGIVVAALLFGGQGCTPKPATPAGPVEPVAKVTWENTIGPLLSQKCGGCHGSSGGLSLATYEDALKGGRRGPAIQPGKGEESLLVRALRGTEPGLPRMPANRPPLSEDEISLISGWIDSGAPK
ncbi:MAG: c-type cytochrome domain-containing protein [Anaerolineae bacterium]